MAAGCDIVRRDLAPHHEAARPDSGRKQADDVLATLAAIVEGSNDAIIGRAPDGTILSWNAAAERMFGYTAAEAIGRDLSLVPPERQHESLENRKLARQGVQVPYHDTVRITRDGRRIDVSLSVSSIKDGGGKVVGFAAILRDITQRLAAEENLRLAAAVIESSQEGIMITDASNRIISVNPAFTAITGHTPDEVIGKTPAVLSSGIQGKEFYQGMWASIKATGHWQGEIWDRRKNGELYCEMLSVSTVKNPQGATVYHTAIFSDITHRKQADETRAQLAAIVDASDDAILSRDLEGKILSWNAGAEKMFGYAAAEVVGRSVTLLAPPERQYEAQHNTWLVQQGKPIPSFETVRVAKDGRPLHVQISASGIKDDAGNVTGLAAIYHDIGERKRAEQSRAQLAAIVENANDAIIGRSLDGTITSWNAAAERIFGYSASEAIGQSTAMLVPESLRKLGENNKALRRGVAIPAHEKMRVTKDGRIISVISSISPVRNAAGEVVSAAVITHDISEMKQAERELKSKAALTGLLESLARAANEAATTQEALRTCVARICDYGGWMLGRVGTFAPGQREGAPQSSLWHCPQPDHYAGFIEISNRYNYAGRSDGQFVSAALRGRRPVWVSDFSATPGFGRLADAMKCGIRAGFVFPVVVGGNVLAFLEFFGSEVREPDTLFVAAIGSVSSQLARVIERQHALDEARANEQKLDSILGALHEVVWSMDPVSGRLIYLNAAARKLTRRPVNDFLAKPRLWRRMIHRDDRSLVRAGARTLTQEGRLTHEFRIVLADGEVRTVENRAHAVLDAGGKVLRIDGTIIDITERKQAEERSDYLAHYDAVTGLPNRRLFNDRLTLALARDRRLGAMTALLLLDLDRFKQINESFGHGVGDKVLQAVTARLQERLREVDTIARFGGDEFIVILESVGEKAQALRVAEKIVEAMAEPFVLQGEEIFATASVGVALSPADADSVEKLIENAEFAMYQAKEEGRNTLQLFVPEQNSRRSSGLGMESKLRRAIERDELLLHYQPKVNIKTGAIVGAEALVRWRNPDLGLVSPADFIPLAEETDLIVPIGEWVLHSACMQASAWRREGHALTIAVNLSARQFRQKNLCDIVKQTLADSELPAGCLELEITESMIMHRAEQAIATLQQLHDIGLTLSVDDFGTGYSSLSYLNRFPVHNLKIDQSFVCDLHKNDDNAAIVRAVIALAQNLNLKTIAEGVETEQQLIFLAGLHCDEYQGFYFSRPLPAAEFLRLLQDKHAAANATKIIMQAAKAARDRAA